MFVQQTPLKQDLIRHGTEGLSFIWEIEKIWKATVEHICHQQLPLMHANMMTPFFIRSTFEPWIAIFTKSIHSVITTLYCVFLVTHWHTLVLKYSPLPNLYIRTSLFCFSWSFSSVQHRHSILVFQRSQVQFLRWSVTFSLTIIY